MKHLILILFLLFNQVVEAQKYATKIIPLNDTTIHQFKDVNELYFLYDNRFNSKLQKLVKKLSVSKSQQSANKIINEIASIKNPESAVILTLDHFFKNTKPVAGSNVEHVLQKLSNSNAYYLLNENFLQNSIDKNLPFDIFKQKIQDTLGWKYGYGAFYFLSAEDSLYLSKMKKVNVGEIDEQVEIIIEKYISEYTSPFRYDVNAIINEIKEIRFVVDAQHDGCLIKTMQLPNWDKIGIVIVKGKDTVERVYTIQMGEFKMFKWGKCISFPIRSNSDLLFYKGVEYGLHFVANTRKQCEENERQHQESLKEYEEWKKQNK